MSLSGLEKEEIQKQAVSVMMSKYPNCSNQYHMCCDTVGAIATSSDKGISLPQSSLAGCFNWFAHFSLKDRSRLVSTEKKNY